MARLSVFVTTFNNARTLRFCLESVKWADEIVVLDSFSQDGTLEIAREYGARIYQHEFLGFGKQKQLAMDKTTHRWVLLLDADEALTPGLQREIQALLQAGPQPDGYVMLRQEQYFWRMSSRHARLARFMRMFDKTKGRMTEMPIHAAPRVEGRTRRLREPFYHFGWLSVEAKVERINRYSTGLVADKLAKGQRGSPWMMVLYPPFYFLRSYLFGRNIVNGWVGFMIAVLDAMYVFLKYAKVYEHLQFERHGSTLLPENAPEVEHALSRRPA